MKPGRAGLAAVSRDHLAWIQTTKFSSAEYVQITGENQKTEELLEKFEVQECSQEARPQRTVLSENGENGNSPTEGAKWPERMTKGKMLTTPSRLFKLIIPLTTVGIGGHEKEIEPIAILVHPQQPLSYLERLIQSELPPIKGHTDKLRPPAISFIAIQHDDNAIKPKKRIEDEIDLDATQTKEKEFIPGNDGVGGSKPLNGRSPSQHRRSREEDVETYSYPCNTNGAPPRDGEPERFVRWSQATEIGDFIRDAARAGEFIVTIEGAPSSLSQIRVTVPSFNERTYYLRMRLRKLSRRIQTMADVKEECDALAHRGAQRVAIGGFGILSIWWFTVYRLTFETDLGWDTMEPVTYLVSLSTLMGGYLWFLYHNREISYKSALDFTISARQKKLYQLHRVDLQLWESLIDEGNSLRGEIKNIAAEYDAEWNERADEQDKRVMEVLKSDRRQKHGKKKDSDDKNDEDDR
ncbi:Coiled-coil domain containing protein 109, C-terminal [Penicillium digitatum]|uniref:Calcium uniporter protein n=1 Tax=Penicillium digitatum TaxID=36651 RepID=A0A7T6XKL6_PENDI|nr:Coiled-coil domain containing protein 109, C-terminal [Penicillium digitatum]